MSEHLNQRIHRWAYINGSYGKSVEGKMSERSSSRPPETDHHLSGDIFSTDSPIQMLVLSGVAILIAITCLFVGVERDRLECERERTIQEAIRAGLVQEGGQWVRPSE